MVVFSYLLTAKSKSNMTATYTITPMSRYVYFIRIPLLLA